MATLIRTGVFGFAGMALAVMTSHAQSDAKALFQSGNPRRNIEIQYWLQTSDGRRLTERMAASVTGRFTLHLRSNTDGFLAVWTTVDGRILIPGDNIQANRDCRVPGDFRTSASASEGLVVVLFARSQTEQVWNIEDALSKLSRLQPSIVKQSGETPGSVGTYVGNREGGPTGVEILLTR